MLNFIKVFNQLSLIIFSDQTGMESDNKSNLFWLQLTNDDQYFIEKYYKIEYLELGNEDDYFIREINKTVNFSKNVDTQQRFSAKIHIQLL
jgi:hypothetical protein